MPDRWASFDCYGTLVDWRVGIGSTMARMWPEADASELLDRYHEIEPRVQLESALPYREVLRQTLRLLADDEGLPLSRSEEYALAESLPSWPAFAEVPDELGRLRARGWRLAILSNTDPDLLAASLDRIGVPVDTTVTAADARSYKPAHGHWLRFRELVLPRPNGHVHVAASLFHDIQPAGELGIPAVWINRLGETSDLARTAELESLAGLADVLDSLVPATL
ncbi:MAG: HAD family hydrolase [Actinomycetota bacterium]|nr:HAD family hydrolase [Actinomycetota bacterium]